MRRAARLMLTIMVAATAAAGGEARRHARADSLTDEMRAVYYDLYRETVPTRTFAALQQQAREAVAGADLDGGGLSARDIEMARNREDARLRGQRIQHYFGSDLDRDGVLTLAEYKTLLRLNDVQSYYSAYERARAENRPPPAAVADNRSNDSGHATEFFHGLDRDGDARLTLAEVFAYVPPAVIRPARAYVEEEQYLVLDANGDGKVTMAEVDSTSAAFLAEQALAGVGPWPQGPSDDEEVYPNLVDAVRCPLPAPSADTRIVRLGAREGGQMSDLALGGQDEKNFVVSIEIEPGSEPLYIVATSDYPVLWRVSGATERVQAFVGSSRARDSRFMWPAVGVTGLARSRFHTVPHACFGDFAETGIGTYFAPSSAARLVARRLGRSADIAFAAYQPQGVRLPSAQPFKVATEVPQALQDLGNEKAAGEWADFLRYFPGGIASIKPRQVVARTRPEAYQVYPDRAGLARLLEQGAIAPVGTSSDFEIVRQFRFPADLPSMTFQLPDHVPLPTGHPGQSRVILKSDRKICLIGCR